MKALSTWMAEMAKIELTSFGGPDGYGAGDPFWVEADSSKARSRRSPTRLARPYRLAIPGAAASIATKMLQELGGATVIGPLIVGLDKPVQIVSLGAKDTDIVNMAALAAFNIGG
jgi:hypothetical protein